MLSTLFALFLALFGLGPVAPAEHGASQSAIRKAEIRSLNRHMCQSLKGDDAWRAEARRWRDLGARVTVGDLIVFCAFTDR
jgi:hypothetical protein